MCMKEKRHIGEGENDGNPTRVKGPRQGTTGEELGGLVNGPLAFIWSTDSLCEQGHKEKVVRGAY